jgi:hypothetical protein
MRLRSTLLALAAAAIAAATATSAPAQVPDPSVNFATSLTHQMVAGRELDPDGFVRVQISWALDHPERCTLPSGEQVALRQLLFEASGPRGQTGFDSFRQVAQFTSFDARRTRRDLDIGRKYQYQVIAFCPAWGFDGSALVGPSFAIDIREDTDPQISYFGTWVTRQGADFSGGSTHEARGIGDPATINYTDATINYFGLAAAWVTTRDPKPPGDQDGARVACDGVLCAVLQTSLPQPPFTAPKPRQVQSAGFFRSFRWDSVPGMHQLRVIANDHDGVDLDAFVIAVRCEPTC